MQTYDIVKLASRLVVLSLGIAASVASAQISFTDVTTAAGVTHSSESYGAAFGDLNGDAYLDIYSSNHRTQDSLFLNRGNGTFVDVATQTMDWQNRPNADTHGGTWADYNNDGKQDLMVSTGTGNLSMFLVNENQRLIDLTVPLGLGEVNLGGRLPVWLDYDGDHLLDVVVTQYGGVAKLFHQLPNGTFVDNTTSAKLLCVRFMYAHLFDANGDGHLDFLCPDETYFPQKIYDPTKFPWVKLFDSAAPAGFFPIVPQVADSVVADFNNDGRMDIFLLSNVQLRPSSVVQGGPNNFEALLAGGTKGFQFLTTGSVTFNVDWNKVDEGVGTDITKIQIGAGGHHPSASTFTLDPNDPTNAGSPPAPTDPASLPIMQISYTPTSHFWTARIVTKLTPTSPSIFSQGYFQVSSTAAINGLKGTGLWPSDKAGRPTLLINTPGKYVDQTVAAGLDTPVQCSSVTAGDFDNDMYIDLYPALRHRAPAISPIFFTQSRRRHLLPPCPTRAAPPARSAGRRDGAGTADSVITADYDVDGFLDLFVTNGMNLRPLYYRRTDQAVSQQRQWQPLDRAGPGRHQFRPRRHRRAHLRDGQRRDSAASPGRPPIIVGRRTPSAALWLGRCNRATLTVEWPSGTVETYPYVAADKLYTITEKRGQSCSRRPWASPRPIHAAHQRPNGAIDSGVYLERLSVGRMAPQDRGGRR